ncbi:hypothetical protein YC2023_112993 [Brassica napus]|uniref:Secreted protein n=2 Tax=Brassica TaxID=3705 RepID=A0A3P6DKK9_BRAOL|nr:unnamed protein product [Brassica napus]VDD27880.1 unnamed protein product [Brassica oleracea]VDD27881.1 unnamed protein product [Brassica oleracea]
MFRFQRLKLDVPWLIHLLTVSTLQSSCHTFADIIQVKKHIEPEFRPLMCEVVQDLLDTIRRERHGSGEPSAD